MTLKEINEMMAERQRLEGEQLDLQGRLQQFLAQLFSKNTKEGE
jgi:hypothetical protein